jgi:transglutaminase-like putative cysteine protease
MRIAIEHKTHYRFSEPQARIVQMLRLTPTDTQDQTVVSWMIGVDCDARLRDAVDGYGNAVTMLYADGPLAGIDVTVTGEVLTLESKGVIRGGFEPLPPGLYLRTTPRTEPAGELVDFARTATEGGADVLEPMHRLNAALHGRFDIAPEGKDQGFSAGAAFALERAGPRDLAQMFVAAARALGTPARYVSGYRSDGVAHCGPHAWAEAHVGAIGWVGFDPATGLSPDEAYVRVAVGLDATGAAPIAGTRIGAGKEELDVDLQVDRIGGDG